jgi:hypothetical protein
VVERGGKRQRVLNPYVIHMHPRLHVKKLRNGFEF